MEIETTSVSKGVFVFKSDIVRPTRRPKSRKKPVKSSTQSNSQFATNLWYKEYCNLWKDIEEQIEELNNDMFSSVLKNLVQFIENAHNEDTEFIPTAALLTGVNMPDHAAQFSSLCKQIKQRVSPHVASIYSQDCQNIKNLIENMMDQFINDEENSFNEDEMVTEDSPVHIKKSQMNVSVLQCWYDNLYKETNIKSPKKLKTKSTRKSLVVIFPEFESLNLEVLQKFLLIVSGRIHSLPFVIIFGIATSTNTLTNSIPYKVTSRMSIKVFHSQPSSIYLNTVLENVFFNMSCPFHLGGRVFNLLMDIFLFYDLSVNNFIQNVKFAIMEHFCHGNAMALCNLNKTKTSAIIKGLDHESLENARHLLSFRKLVESESYENRIKLLTDDDYFRKILNEEVIKIQKYIRRLHLFLQCLLILVADLPKAPLGKQLRELYPLAVSKNITQTAEYKQCFQLLSFQSKEELSSKLQKIVNFLSNHVKSAANNKVWNIVEKLSKHLNDLSSFNLEDLADAVDEIQEENDVTIQNNTDRKQFREKLIALSKHENNKSLNRYEKFRRIIIEDISKMFEEYLLEPSSFYFHEIFFFDDISIQNYIVGTHRAAVHNALNDPCHYLQCECCNITNSSSIKPLMPDICIAFKLHLECGKLINLYDWLQAYLSIVDPTEIEDEDDKRVVNPRLQARFTQAVAELEYLGFIKSSKRKVDHVTRLTWGG